MPPGASRHSVGQQDSLRASRSWWDGAAADYYAEHGRFLGDADLLWGPEGLRESQAGLLGRLEGRAVLEFGCGAGQGARWCARQGARVVAVDLSLGMLAQGRRLDAAHEDATHDATRGAATYLQCDAARLPLADACVDVAFSAYGALQFVADSRGLLQEVARVVRPGGQVMFSLTHPIRWAFPDDPGVAGLSAHHSYFDRDAYVECDEAGRPSYVEQHRTLGDLVGDLGAAGLQLTALVEPEWTAGDHVWGGWSRLRGELLPGTAIFVCHRHEKPTHD